MAEFIIHHTKTEVRELGTGEDEPPIVDRPDIAAKAEAAIEEAGEAAGGKVIRGPWEGSD